MRRIVGLYLCLMAAVPAWSLTCDQGFMRKPSGSISSSHWDHAYFWGFGEHTPSTPDELRLDLPTAMPDQIGLHLPALSHRYLKMAKSNRGELSMARAFDYLTTHQSIAQRARLLTLGHGLTFDAFVVEPIADDDFRNLRELSPRDYKKWRLSRGIKTLKALRFRNADPIKTMLSLQKTLIALDTLSYVAPSVTFAGEILFHVTPIHTSSESEATGVYEQEYIYGPNAFDLQQVLSAGKIYLGENRYMSAHEFLALWDLTFGEVTALEPKMRALEVAFRKLDKWASHQTLRDALEGRKNRLRDSRAFPVMFDLNFGRNIIFDVRLKRFVIVDA